MTEQLSQEELQRIDALLELDEVKELGLDERLKDNLKASAQSFFASLHRAHNLPTLEQIKQANKAIKRIEKQASDLIKKFKHLEELAPWLPQYDFTVSGAVRPSNHKLAQGGSEENEDIPLVPGQYVCNLFGKPSKYGGPRLFLIEMLIAIDKLGKLKPEHIAGRFDKLNITSKEKTKVAASDLEVSSSFYSHQINYFIRRLMFVYETATGKVASVITEDDLIRGEFMELLRACVNCISDEPIGDSALKGRLVRIKTANPNRPSLKAINRARARAKLNS